MKKTNMAYRVLVGVSIIFILYSLVRHYVFDPEATAFLSHKTGLKRELNLPVWLKIMYIHVAFACLAMAAGLVNFSRFMLEKHRKIHRINGYVYVVSVMMVVLTSGYMAPYSTGGKINSIAFNIINIIWPVMTVMAIVHIKKKRIVKHRNYMIRSYAFCFTNMLIHLITFTFNEGFGLDYASSYTFGLYSSLVLLLILPDMIIRYLNKTEKNKTIGTFFS
ncbi:DUF2306 domain-containing protein [Paenibacillus sp. 7523-1]|uniref:DUF2306 domain-containing protein n=1 Tax=Paenibacillus sp. 7523-1 TaxID=2022550 RepID=UPI000BA7812C|nr:DUF2306 domain-containing protein [Paenibacillus sp. 7523-1]PAD33098.1 hypothetical protein CHH60_03215 [Paenibacillus sp. 7523-1]